MYPKHNDMSEPVSPGLQALPSLSPLRVREIAGWLPVRAGYPVPNFDDRSFWARTSALPTAPWVIAEAEFLAATPLAELTEDLYQEFRRIGVRQNFDKIYSERLHRLRKLVLAEGIEDRGRFLPAVLECFQSILDEPSWIIAAHARDRIAWADARDSVDLGASARVWTLATADWLLAGRLPTELRRRLRTEARDRVFTPYLERMRSGDRRDFHWMNDPHNWNPVCHAGVLGAALWLVASAEERAKFVAAFEACAPFYLRGFAEDGTCEEGPSYWEFGFGNFLIAAELIRTATGGRLDLLNDPKIGRVALAGVRMEIAGGVCPAFADAKIGYTPKAWVSDFVALRFGNGTTRGLPSFALPRLYYTTFDLLLPRRSDDGARSRLALRDWFPDGAVLICRSRDPERGLAAAFKAGHNGVAHNHNDVGAFVVVCDGKLALADLGADLPYTGDSFAAGRYDSDLMNSFGHPVPLVAGRRQATGSWAAGVTVRTSFTDARDEWEIDLTVAYRVEELERLTREFVFTRERSGRVEIVDRVRFSSPQDFGTALMLLAGQTWTTIGLDRVRISGDGVAVDVTVRVEGAGWRIVERPLRRIRADRPSAGTRLGIDLVEPAAEAVIRLWIERAQAADVASISGYADERAGAESGCGEFPR